MKDFKTQEMTEKEIEESLKLFSKLLKRNGYGYQHSNPLQENCYISSSDVIGVYFPNSVIEHPTHKNYNLIALSKVNNKLCVVFSLKDEIYFRQQENPPKNIYFYLDQYKADTIESLLYDYDFLKIKEKITNRIKEYNETIEVLTNIKMVSKKNGEPFANVLKNFESKSYLYFDFCICSPVVSSVKIGQVLTMYRTDENKKISNTPTVEEVQQLINTYLGYYNGYKAKATEDLKNLEKYYIKLQKIAESVKDFKNLVNNWYDFKDTFESMTI